MLENREKLFKVLKKEELSSSVDSNAFINRFFKNEKNVLGLYTALKGKKYTQGKYDGQPLIDYKENEFFKKYACDLEWAKNTNYCSSQQTTPQQIIHDWSSYPCVVSLAKSKGVKIDRDGAYLIDNFRYFANGRKGDLTARKVLDYTCDDPEFQTQQTPDNTQNTGQNTQTSNKLTYDVCPEETPVKKFCKNQIVRDIQRCLRDKHQMTLKDDGKFGPETEKALMKLGLKGDVITAKEYIRACPPTDTGQSSKPNTTGYEDYTNDEYEVDLSDRPEQEYSTGYEDYNLEEN
jgi:hypothetical protein